MDHTISFAVAMFALLLGTIRLGVAMTSFKSDRMGWAIAIGSALLACVVLVTLGGSQSGWWSPTLGQWVSASAWTALASIAGLLAVEAFWRRREMAVAGQRRAEVSCDLEWYLQDLASIESGRGRSAAFVDEDLQCWKRRVVEFLDANLSSQHAQNFRDIELSRSETRDLSQPRDFRRAACRKHRERLSDIRESILSGTVAIRAKAGPSGEPLPSVEYFVYRSEL